MNSEAELLQKLMISKKIMEKHNDIGRGQTKNMAINQETINRPTVDDFQPLPATYNIPQEYIQEQPNTNYQFNNNIPIEQKISNSKLPDEIKKLMLEHPIQQPSMGVPSGAVLSEELVEKANRLMNTSPKKQVQESTPNTQTTKNQSLNYSEIKDIIRETVQDVLYENGLLVESEKNASEMFKFRVGQHVFEGKVTKIRKISQ